MRPVLLLLMVVLAGSACGEPEDSSAASDRVTPSLEELFQEFTLSRAELEDIQFVANQEGWTLAEAINRIGWQNEFSLFVQELRETYPHEFAGAAILWREGPRSVSISFRSDVPPGVRDDPRLAHLDVEFREMLGFDEAQLVAQTNVVHFAMRDAGFGDVSTSPDLATGRIEVFAVRRAEDEGRSDESIIAGLPEVVRADNVRIVFVDEIEGSFED